MFRKSFTSKALVFILLFTMLFSSFGVYAAENSIPTRDEIDEQYKWRLEDIYETDEAWQADFEKLQKMLPTIEKYKGKLKSGPNYIADCLKSIDEMQRLHDKLYVYAWMNSDSDTSIEKYLEMGDRADSIASEMQAAFAFIEPELSAIPDNTLNEYMKSDDLKNYDLLLENIIKSKEHSLSESEERIMALAGNLLSTPENIYKAYKYSDRELAKILDKNGEELTLSSGIYSIILESSDRDMRRKAFEGEFNSYNKNINTLASTLYGEVKTNIFNAKARKYDSALEAALLSSNIDPKVYDSFIEAANSNLKPLHRYVSLRKKLLGIKDKVHYYDMYVPMLDKVGTDIPYEDAKKMVLEALTPLGNQYNEDLKIAFNSRWIDVYETQGKYTGGYCWGSYDTHPYVLINYNGTLSEVSTLAHELGHAMNSYYSNKKQPYSKADYETFTAEVASTTNEAIMYDYLIANAESKEEKMYLIGSYLEQIRGSIYTQLMYAEFEKTIYEAAEAGKTLTATYLNDTWGSLMQKYYGEDFEVDELVKVWWSRIPHFYWNFYVYTYASGLSAGITLSDNVVNGGVEARDAYLDFLAAGGSDGPIELLKSAGADMSSPKPVEKALQKFDELITELEKLMEE
ncbi:oligoendopeptidase F [Wukongibacter sp. M2B1]|uniref:oligoendopeptidase F n=1 Tax=Wukongibacter sp. M2B1 TaxID=3088895 RepID=UPI003D7A788C